MVLYKMKEAYTNIFLSRQTPSYCLLPPYSLVYEFWWRSKCKVDMMNPCAIVDKFGCDALVKAGIIPEDSTKEIIEVHFYYRGIDPDRPRVTLTVNKI